jgi:hypothetical protein
MLEVIPRKTVEYALCLDTLHKNRRFTEAEEAVVKRWATDLQQALARIDRKLFVDEVARRDALWRLSQEREADRTDDDVKKEIEAKRSAMLKEWKAAEKDAIRDGKEFKSPPVTAEDVSFRYRQEIVYGLRNAIAEFRTYNVFKGPLSVMQALLYMLDYKQAQVCDAKGEPDWKKIRAVR